jgi:uncharacterized protein
MLSFDLGALSSKAAWVDDSLAPDDAIWESGDQLPSQPVRVVGRLSGAGSGRFYFSGHVSGLVAAECRRCLEDAPVSVDDEVHLLFAEQEDAEADDPDVYRFDSSGGLLDLRPAIREQWLLNAPGFALCREDCKGLCPRCGENLNEGPCGCASAPDPRWEALRQMRDGTSHPTSTSS